MEKNERLARSIDVKLWNRPLKVAYLVPVDNDEISNLIVDAIFSESYSRWGGRNTLIIPYKNNKVLDVEYYKWLDVYDIDILYSYLDLPSTEIEKLDNLTHPIVFEKHSVDSINNNEWHAYYPSWHSNMKPIASLSTISTPMMKRNNNTVLLTQSINVSESRFLPDNFGVSKGVNEFTNEIKGLYDTICYCKENVSQTKRLVTKLFHSPTSVLKDIQFGDVTTFSKLSVVYSGRISHPIQNDSGTVNRFIIYIGDTCLDRINFWNSRNLSINNYQDYYSALIISPSMFDDSDACNNINEFIGFKTSYSSECIGVINIRSTSLSKKDCSNLIAKLGDFINYKIEFNDDFSLLSIAKPSRWVYGIYNLSNIDQRERCYEKESSFLLSDLEHFHFIPAEYSFLKKGGWCIDVIVDRIEDNNLNVGFSYSLPRGHGVRNLFFSSDYKVNLNNIFSVFIREPYNFSIGGKSSKKYLDVYIPSDFDIIKSISTSQKYQYFDVRGFLNDKISYDNISISDKGQQHYGVVSKFASVTDAADIIGNYLFRKLLRKPEEKFTLKSILGIINQIKEIDKHIAIDVKDKKKLLRESAKDTIEFLLKNGVMEQTYTQRCPYCGNQNKKSIDLYKINNNCGVCGDSYYLPIDAEWDFGFSPYVLRSLVEHNGLPVLLAISSLITNSNTKNVIYLPEVNLHSDGGEYHHEIDILMLRDGLFLVGEVKGSVASFVDDNDNSLSFIDKLKRLTPNEGILVFESVCDNDNEKEYFRDKLKLVIETISSKLDKLCDIKYIILSEESEYYELELCAGILGSRANKVIDS